VRVGDFQKGLPCIYDARNSNIVFGGSADGHVGKRGSPGGGGGGGGGVGIVLWGVCVCLLGEMVSFFLAYGGGGDAMGAFSLVLLGVLCLGGCLMFWGGFVLADRITFYLIFFLW